FGLSAVAMLVLWTFVRPSGARGDFYAVVSHDVMVGTFGVVGSLVVLSMTIGFARALTNLGSPGLLGPARRGIKDALTLRHLHATGEDCTSHVEARTPWRRYFHHCTFYGFALCMASTTVAAIYHAVFGWRAPYAYSSLPVILGTVGGIGLLIGPLGLLIERD